MELYLATDSGRLQQAMACTAQLAHMSYRIGPDGTLLASPLPDTLRGGLLMLSDEGGTYPDASEGLCRQLVQECLRRRYAGVVLDAMPPEDYIDIKYEDFCKDPEGYVKQIYDHLGIDGFEEAKPYFDAYLESQKNYQKNKFELTPELRDKINAKLGFYFAHYGYEMQK